MKIFINDLVLEVIYDSKNRMFDSSIIPIADLHHFTRRFIEDEQSTESKNSYFLIAKDKKDLLKHLKKNFKIIKAAGGVVRNDKNEILVIYRNGKWDIPKGKVEKGESIKKAAVREVEEECGISDLNLLDKLLSTYHIYEVKNKLVLKKTIWYNMTCFKEQILTPQQEEGIEDVRWVVPNFMNQPGLETYKSLKEVIREISFI